jgi:hypothetical protein
MLRRIFGPKGDEMIRCWRKLHNEELHNLSASSDVSRMIKSRGMRWTCSAHGRDDECMLGFGRKT